MTVKFLQKEGDSVQHRQQMAETMNLLLKGRDNSTSTFTLTANATTTTVIDPAFESSMVPIPVATTAHAATAMSKIYISSRSKGSFVVTHDNTADTDRVFLYTRRG